MALGAYGHHAAPLAMWEQHFANVDVRLSRAVARHRKQRHAFYKAAQVPMPTSFFLFYIYIELSENIWCQDLTGNAHGTLFRWCLQPH